MIQREKQAHATGHNLLLGLCEAQRGDRPRAEARACEESLQFERGEQANMPIRDACDQPHISTCPGAWDKTDAPDAHAGFWAQAVAIGGAEKTPPVPLQ